MYRYCHECEGRAGHHRECPEGDNGAAEMDFEQMQREAGRSGRDDHELDIQRNDQC